MLAGASGESKVNSTPTPCPLPHHRTLASPATFGEPSGRAKAN